MWACKTFPVLFSFVLAKETKLAIYLEIKTTGSSTRNVTVAPYPSSVSRMTVQKYHVQMPDIKSLTDVRLLAVRLGNSSSWKLDMIRLEIPGYKGPYLFCSNHLFRKGNSSLTLMESVSVDPKQNNISDFTTSTRCSPFQSSPTTDSISGDQGTVADGLSTGAPCGPGCSSAGEVVPTEMAPSASERTEARTTASRGGGVVTVSARTAGEPEETATTETTKRDTLDDARNPFISTSPSTGATSSAGRDEVDNPCPPCYCPPTNLTGNRTTTLSREENLKRLVSELVVDKKTTSSYLRRKTSADDSRRSAQAIGCVGVVLLILPVAFFALFDLINLAKYSST